MDKPVELLVLTDVKEFDYETLSMHLLRVSYQVCRERYTLVIDQSNQVLAELLKRYAKDESVAAIRLMPKLSDALQCATTVLLFTTPRRKTLYDRCVQEAQRRPLDLHVVMYEDRSHG